MDDWTLMSKVKTHKISTEGMRLNNNKYINSHKKRRKKKLINREVAYATRCKIQSTKTSLARTCSKCECFFLRRKREKDVVASVLCRQLNSVIL